MFRVITTYMYIVQWSQLCIRRMNKTSSCCILTVNRSWSLQIGGDSPSPRYWDSYTVKVYTPRLSLKQALQRHIFTYLTINDLYSIICFFQSMGPHCCNHSCRGRDLLRFSIIFIFLDLIMNTIFKIMYFNYLLRYHPLPSW
jgi:hypothetical protein